MCTHDSIMTILAVDYKTTDANLQITNDTEIKLLIITMGMDIIINY